MLVFLGRACSGFQDIPLGTADRELAIFSHSKKHERGKVAIQLGFEVPKVSTWGCGQGEHMGVWPR